jgi:hypothetical protein
VANEFGGGDLVGDREQAGGVAGMPSAEHAGEAAGVQCQRARAALAARPSAGSRKARTKWSIPLRGAAETRVEVAETGTAGDADLASGTELRT